MIWLQVKNFVILITQYVKCYWKFKRKQKIDFGTEYQFKFLLLNQPINAFIYYKIINKKAI